MTIESGTFICTGNVGVVNNYGTNSTLTINGGNYQNVCPQVNGSDYRRCVWTAEGSNTEIRNVTCESPWHSVCTNGTMTIDNELRITPDKGEFMVKKGKPGSIVLNTFTYLLKRDSPLRTGNTETLLNAINSNVDKIINGVHFMMEENIFLRPVDSYKDMDTAFDQLKMKKSHLKHRK